MLSAHGVDLVFDVGANAGQFALWLREAGYRGRIVSFEPLSSAYEQLLKRSRRDALWTVAPRVAIGSEEGEIEMHVSANLASSSILDMAAEQVAAAPESRYVGKERVLLRRLDSFAHYVEPDSALFLKVDTQGYEDRVLQGAAGLLDRCVGLQLELSFVPLYQGQQLFDGMLEILRARGFDLWALWPCFADPGSGRLLQVDATFFRR